MLCNIYSCLCLQASNSLQVEISLQNALFWSRLMSDQPTELDNAQKSVFYFYKIIMKWSELWYSSQAPSMYVCVRLQNKFRSRGVMLSISFFPNWAPAGNKRNSFMFPNELGKYWWLCIPVEQGCENGYFPWQAIIYCFIYSSLVLFFPFVELSHLNPWGFSPLPFQFCPPSCQGKVSEQLCVA